MLIARIRREPAVAIGIAAAVILAVVQTLAGQGVIGMDIAATFAMAFDPATGWALPIILGVVTRFFVYSPPAVREATARAARTGDPEVKTSPPA